MKPEPGPLVYTGIRTPPACPKVNTAAHPAGAQGHVIDRRRGDHPGTVRRTFNPALALSVAQHRDPADGIRPVGHRDRQVGEHPPRRMHRQTLVGVQQRRAHPLDQAGVLGHLPQQPDPGVRDHALPVRADLHPPARLLPFTVKCLFCG